MCPLKARGANKLMANWNTEVELILEDFKKKYRDVHSQRRSVEEFDGKISQTLEAAKISVDTEVAKLKDTLGDDIGGSERLQPSELSKMYDVDESVLIDLQVIDPLQNLHILCKKTEGLWL